MIKADDTTVQPVAEGAYEGQDWLTHCGLFEIADGIDSQMCVFCKAPDDDLRLFLTRKRKLSVKKELVLSKASAIALANKILELYA